LFRKRTIGVIMVIIAHGVEACAERLFRMKVLQGKSVFRGICEGKLFFYERTQACSKELDAANRESVVESPERECASEATDGVFDVAVQLQRWECAQAEVLQGLTGLCGEKCKTMGEAYAAIFETQKMLLEDEGLVAYVRQMIEHEKRTAEEAVKRAGEVAAGQLLQAEDAYIRERAQDVRDITAQLLDALVETEGKERSTQLQESQEKRERSEPGILVAKELFPGELVRLNRSKVLGIVLLEGSLTDHTAILAKGFGIPMIVQAGTKLSEEFAGKDAVLDAGTGTLYIEPDGEIRYLYEKQFETAQKLQVKIPIYANAGTVQEVELAIQNGAEGIGLFRSELLYMEAAKAPDEEALTDFYRRILEAAKGREVIVRTFDLGSDKRVEWLTLQREENPALGLRGVRLALAKRELLCTQLKALYRAARYGKLSVMYPMISSVEELRQVREAEREARAQLEEDGVLYENKVSTGIMIETPSAALLSEELAKEVDFFSVGTNDLTQYTLAKDRQSADMCQLTHSEKEAVFKLIRMVAEGAHKAGIGISVCGEMASEAAFWTGLTEAGVDALSVPAPLVSEIRQTV